MGLFKMGIHVGRTFDYVVPDTPTYSMFKKKNYWNAMIAASEVLNLPIYPSLDYDQIEYIADSVNRLSHKMVR